MKATPGPWKQDEAEYSQYVFGPDDEMICEMRGWGYLTGNRRNLSDTDAMKIQAANCRLIAAAPELLEALLACEVTLKAFLPGAFATISLVESAIDKAKGL